MVGAASAIGVQGGPSVAWWRVVGALLVSLLLQVGVNYANDYSDGVKGTDDVRVGPIRLVASGAATPKSVKLAAMTTLLIAAVVGLVLAVVTSWWLLVIGGLAILAAWGYTGGPKPYGYLGLGELFVFVFFGLVATIGTAYVAIEQIPGVTWVAACGVGFLACALLVVNNLRDIPTDRSVGKRTLAVRLGDRTTRWMYLCLIVAAFAVVGVMATVRPWSAIAFASIAVARTPARSVLRGAAGRELIGVLGRTGKTQLAYGALLAIGLAIG